MRDEDDENRGIRRNNRRPSPAELDAWIARIRRIVWVIALGLIVLLMGIGLFQLKDIPTLRGLGFLAYVIVCLPPAILIWILASCMDGILRK